jgi:HJR/Mrr/RecB family endonuclease
MAAGIPNWVLLVAGVALLAILAGQNQDGQNKNTGNFNRGVLQQMTPTKFRRYVATVWSDEGYETTTDPDDAEYVDVTARSADELVAISVRSRKEENRVSENAVRRFARSSQSMGADRAVMVSSSFYTEPAREAASEFGIQLRDGDETARRFTNNGNLPE